MGSLEKVDWCLEQLAGFDVRLGVGGMATLKFQELLRDELSGEENRDLARHITNYYQGRHAADQLVQGV